MNFSSSSADWVAKTEVAFPDEDGEKKPLLRRTNIFGLAFLVGAIVVSVVLVANKPNIQEKSEIVADNIIYIKGEKSTVTSDLSKADVKKGLTHWPTGAISIPKWYLDYHTGKGYVGTGYIKEGKVDCGNVFLRHDKNGNCLNINGVDHCKVVIPSMEKDSDTGANTIDNEHFPGDGFLPDGYVEIAPDQDGFVSILDDRAFQLCKTLKVVKFLGPIKTIVPRAFAGNWKMLRVIYHPDDLDGSFDPNAAGFAAPVVGAGAFAGCRNMVEGGLPDGTLLADREVFFGCNATRAHSFHIPQSLQVVDYKAFYGMTQFTRGEGDIEKNYILQLPNVQSIARKAFKNVYLRGVNFYTAPLVKIDDHAFDTTENLGVLKFPDVSATEEQRTYFGYKAFHLAGITTVWFLGPYTDYDSAFGQSSGYTQEVENDDGSTATLAKVAFEYNRIDCLGTNDPFCGCVFGTKEQAYAVYYQGALHAKWCHFDNAQNSHNDGDDNNDDRLPIETPAVVE